MNKSKVKFAILTISVPVVKIVILTISVALMALVMNNYFAFTNNKKREFLYKWEWKQSGDVSLFDTIIFDTIAASNDTTSVVVHSDMSVTLGRKLIGCITSVHRKLDGRVEITITTSDNKKFEYIDYSDRYK